MNCQVLVLSDDKECSESLSRLLIKERIIPLLAHDLNMALRLSYPKEANLVFLDLTTPGQDAAKVFQQIRGAAEDLPIIAILPYGDIAGAVRAMKSGASDYIVKPLEPQKVIQVLHGALERFRHKLLSEDQEQNGLLRKEMGPSHAIGQLIAEVKCVARSDFSVIVVGETGSGKELVARAIHQVSERLESPFVPVDCGAIPETLLESELFGYEKGAFSGAERQKQGKFETAQNGTIFLDEITNMPLASQAKLLRALQEKTIYRVGGTTPIGIHVRLLVASNKNLEKAVASGDFRRDLYYRLNDFTINIPPLRERKEDIRYLANRFLEITNKELKKNIIGFSDSAIQDMFAYNWPGNVRQLRSTIRRAVLLADDVITDKHLNMRIEFNNEPVFNTNPTLPVNLQEMLDKKFSLKEIAQRSADVVEREALAQVLKHTGGNKAKAARILKIDYKTIHIKLKKFGILTNGGCYE